MEKLVSSSLSKTTILLGRDALPKLTLGRVVQMGIEPLRGVGVIIGRRLGHVFGLGVILGQGRTRDGPARERSGTVRRGRLTDRFVVLDF